MLAHYSADICIELKIKITPNGVPLKVARLKSK